MKTQQLLNGLIDDAEGINKELWRWTENRGTESSDTSDNVNANILKCLQKGNRCMIVGSPCITWADDVQHKDKTNKIIEERKQQRQ